MLIPGSHRVELDGVTQAYEVIGEGPVCFVHPGGPGVDYDYLRMPLLERHMTMVYLHPIGTGKSGWLPGGDYSVAEYARRLELLRDHLDVADGFIMGHSHGGFVALQYALDYPGRARGLIIYGGAPTSSEDLVTEARRQAVLFTERWPDRPEVLTAFGVVDGPDLGEGDIRDASSFLAYMNTTMPLYFADYRKTVSELGKPPALNITAYDPARKPYEWDVRGRLGVIEMPTLVLAGAYDFICPPVWARQIHAEISHSRLVEFANSGHFVHIEEPEDFRKSVHAFVIEVNKDQGAQPV
jgi:proline iminopeptidase